MSNVKLADVVNLKVSFEKGGYPKYKTKYDSDEFLIGRKKDFKESHEQEGNFEYAKPVKGQSQDSWEWKTAPYNRQLFQESFSYFVKGEDVQGWVELSWSANEALKKACGVNQFDKVEMPVEVKVRRPDKAYVFEAIATAKDLEMKPEEDLPF
jgi:hypothetical protein